MIGVWFSMVFCLFLECGEVVSRFALSFDKLGSEFERTPAKSNMQHSAVWER